MSVFVLDTDTLSLLQRRQPTVCSEVAQNVAQITVTVLTVEEQLSGWYQMLRKAKTSDKLIEAYRSLAENVRFLSGLQILDFDRAASVRYEQLKKLKLNVGKFDLRIAAVVLNHGAILVTRNARDIGRVPGLQMEDWSK